MKRFRFPLFAFFFLCTVTVRAQEGTALPFAVTLEGEVATLEEGGAFATVAQPVANNAAIEIGVESDGMIIINVQPVDESVEPVEGTTPALILLKGTNKGTLAETMDRQLLAPGRHLLSVVAEGKTASVLFEVR